MAVLDRGTASFLQTLQSVIRSNATYATKVKSLEGLLLRNGVPKLRESDITFDETLGGAAGAQVHRAHLKTGKEIAFVRPTVSSAMVPVLREAALRSYFPEAAVVKVLGLVYAYKGRTAYVRGVALQYCALDDIATASDITHACIPNPAALCSHSSTMRSELSTAPSSLMSDF